jgi:hypothetical protein
VSSVQVNLFQDSAATRGKKTALELAVYKLFIIFQGSAATRGR